MEQDIIENVLGQRYAKRTRTIWSQRGKVRLGREFWIALLVNQWDLGMPVPEGAIEAYQAQVNNIDLASINARELVLKHDNLAEIEEFNALAGFDCIHKGATTRDKSDNIEQMQVRESLKITRGLAVPTLRRFAARAVEYRLMDTSGRSHFVPAQAITIGKRFANWAEEMLIGFDRLEYLIASYPLRGMKGAVGTQQDMLDLLGSEEKVMELERRMAKYLGFSEVLDSVGQVYPRSLDLEVVSVLLQLVSGAANFANMVRLTAGLGLLYEGTTGGQKGSSAMPHKINSRTCERINSLFKVLRGHLTIAADLAGDQWLEGDVSCSAARRIIFPDAFFAVDGILEATMTVLDQMEVFEGMVEQELKANLPFLSTTRILMAATKRGMGREEAHTLINEHAKAAAKLMRRVGAPSDTFVTLLAADSRLGLERTELEALMANPDHGLATVQVQKVVAKVDKVLKRFPDAATYTPEPML